MLYHSYQFSIRIYEIPRFKTITKLQKRESNYFQKGHGKRGDQEAAEDTTEV